jgi:transcriptional antiterminator RfaH
MAYWCAAQLQANREQLALHMLQQVEGFKVYAPRLRQRRRRHGRWVETLPLLFVSYVFVSIEAQWYRARWAPGVIRLIMDGLQPARVPAPVIAELRRREHRGAIELPKPLGLAPGDQVRIVRGPLRDRLGLYQGMSGRQRIEVLLTLLGGQTRVTLPRGDIELALDASGP